VLLLLLLGTALVLDGYAHNRIGPSKTPGAEAAAGLDVAGPVLDLSRTPARSVNVPAGEVALTFDDGPDPRWTPRLLKLLARKQVRATFFVVGAKVAAHPGLVRRMHDAGHDLGSHTFTHNDIAHAGRLRSALELSLTQTALAGATGVSTGLLRLPYSSDPASFTDRQLRAARSAARLGYLLVAATQDPQDWRRPGVAPIVAASLPPAGHGGVVLLHDSGGDRSQTLEAVARIIDEVHRRGDRFVTVSELINQRPGRVNRPVSALARMQGLGLLAALEGAHLLTLALTTLLVPLGILALLRAVIVVLFARRHAKITRAGPWPDHAPPVTVVVPAYNEAVGIEATVRSLVNSDYPTVEVIVVDDGSTDGTAAIVEQLHLPGVRVIRQPNSGKSIALNTGIAHSAYDVIVMVDGDTIFEPDAIRWLVRPLSDPAVGAVSGNTKVGNRRGLLGRWQHVEYVLGFNLDRRMFDTLRCIPTVPGAVGAFRRSALAEVGGMSDDTLAEDTDVTMALNRAGWRVVYEERAVAWTEAPASLGSLWRQRYRWSYGTMQAMWKHRSAVRDGSRLGRVGLPYVLAFQVLLPLLAPVVDLITVYGLVFLDGPRIAAYWIAFNLLSVLLGVFAFRLDGERLGPLWSVVLQQVVYRQLMYLVVIQSARSALAGHRLHWHRIPRAGMDPRPEVTAAPPP
jgi:poly-beta-1,6 N-acetyl-D-glucosamine synthase